MEPSVENLNDQRSLFLLLKNLDNKMNALLERDDLRNKYYSIKEASEKLGLHRDTIRKRANALGLNPNGEGERKPPRFTGEELEMIRTNDKAAAHIKSMSK